MTLDAGSLRFDIDRLVVSGRRVFGWGWIADRNRTIRDVRVRIEGGAWQKNLATTFGLDRKDVARAFPDFVSAASSGFVVTGYVPEAPFGKVSLEVHFDDGSTATIDVGNVTDVRKGAPATPWLGRKLRTAWRRLKTRDFRGLLHRDRLRLFPTASIEDAQGLEALVRPLRTAGSIRVVFDHDMGGGANHYRRMLIAGWLAADEAVVLCTYHLTTLDYRLRLLLPGKSEVEFRASSFLSLEAVIGQTPVTELFVNSPVSFDDPMMLAEWLARMRATYHKARLTVSAHDYFSVCPSFVLINAEGRYCGIPDLEECARCLKNHEGAHVALSPPSQIVPWRAAWRLCLEAADEIRCFSESTRHLLSRAHPSIASDKMTLVPHQQDFQPVRMPSVDHGSPLVIGVMGTISTQKGAGIVIRMLELLERSADDVRIVVLGTLDAPSASARLKVTGPYERDELPSLIEQNGVNMCLFPSIWPETFSYVVAEMMAMGLPIVAFDLGAPAERLRDYPMARLCGVVSADAALQTARAFHRELAPQATVAA